MLQQCSCYVGKYKPQRSYKLGSYNKKKCNNLVNKRISALSTRMVEEMW